MDDWADEKESLVSVSVSDEEKKNKSPSNGDEQAGSGTGISTEEQKENGERREENGETGAGTGIINSIASKFGVTVPAPGLSTKEDERTPKEESESNGDEQAGPSTSISTEEQKENGETGAGTGIINSIASKFGVTVPVPVPGLSTKEEESAPKEESDSNGGIVNQIISNLLESEDDVPAADEASLLIFVIED